MRTDFKIVTTYAKASLNPEGDIYIKNIGTSRISLAEINRSDVFFGKTDTFTRLSFTSGVAVAGQWGYVFTAGSYDTDSNRIWDTGETIKIIGIPTTALVSGDPVYFQFILPNGVQRSIEFTVS
jgi:flagellar protein FlaG